MAAAPSCDASASEGDRTLRVAAVQFEATDGDKRTNLATMTSLAHRAAAAMGGDDIDPTVSRLVCFHESCVTGYSFLQTLDFDGLAALAEPVPGPTTSALGNMARDAGVSAVGAGLLELEGVLFLGSYAV